MPTFGAHECLERVREHPLWAAARLACPPARASASRSAGGPAASSRRRRPAGSTHDGALTIVTGAVDMSGTETDVPDDRRRDVRGRRPRSVRVVYGDTSSTAYAGVSGGSKVTYTVGRAVELAASEARERLLEVAAAELEIAPEDLEIVDGSVQPAGAPGRGDDDRRARAARS